MEKNVRLRVLLVMELFFERTDEEHSVSMTDILHWLERHGVAGNRKSVYEDIHALQEFGLAIAYSPEKKAYYLAERGIGAEELELLLKVVRASGLLSGGQKEQLSAQLLGLASQYQREEWKG